MSSLLEEAAQNHDQRMREMFYEKLRVHVSYEWAGRAEINVDGRGEWYALVDGLRFIYKDYLFVKTTPVNSPHYIVQQLKGYTSRILRKEFESLRKRIPTLWTRSYYVESVGHISEETIKRYIENQKNQ